jgi:hypothetical protein
MGGMGPGPDVAGDLGSLELNTNRVGEMPNRLITHGPLRYLFLGRVCNAVRQGIVVSDCGPRPGAGSRHYFNVFLIARNDAAPNARSKESYPNPRRSKSRYQRRLCGVRDGPRGGLALARRRKWKAILVSPSPDPHLRSRAGSAAADYHRGAGSRGTGPAPADRPPSHRPGPTREHQGDPPRPPTSAATATPAPTTSASAATPARAGATARGLRDRSHRGPHSRRRRQARSRSQHAS